MVEKGNILAELLKDLDSKITINGDVYIDYNKPTVKKVVKSSDKTQNVVKSEEPKKDPNQPGSLAAQMRAGPSMTKWKREIKARDQVCQCCGDATDLECHHIMPLSKYPSLGTDPGNGIVLCGSCHHDYHDQWQGSESAVTLAKFMKENGQFQ